MSLAYERIELSDDYFCHEASIRGIVDIENLRPNYVALTVDGIP
jgi:hypothetical protein